MNDYQVYLREQKVRAKSKWARKPIHSERFLKDLTDAIDKLEFDTPPETICCMGCRDGTELFIFKDKFPDAQVYGVDIAENLGTVKSRDRVQLFPYDFNKLPRGWDRKFDLVFSNSLDHAFSPYDTVWEWHRVTKIGGQLLLEFSTTPPNSIEYSFTESELPSLLPTKSFEHTTIWTGENKIMGVFKKL